ncbi:MAG TPA: hypothetical protein VGR25_12640 [bacterium]|jgi:hypothetical protein|nr:hypothetical protein [bacterium]
MRVLGILTMLAAATLALTSATLGADMTNAARRQLDTAITHAGLAAGYNSIPEVELHLHHVVNCIEGKSGKNYFKGSGDVCEGMGRGLLADLKDAGMAGAHAAPYAEIGNQVALWGIAKTMAKDVGRAKAAAQMAKLVLEQAKANFK